MRQSKSCSTASVPLKKTPNLYFILLKIGNSATIPTTVHLMTFWAWLMYPYACADTQTHIEHAYYMCDMVRSLSLTHTHDIYITFLTEFQREGDSSAPIKRAAVDRSGNTAFCSSQNNQNAAF